MEECSAECSTLHESTQKRTHTRSGLPPQQIKQKRTSRQTQAGIGHSAPAHKGGHVQNRSRRREQRRGRYRPERQRRVPPPLPRRLRISEHCWSSGLDLRALAASVCYTEKATKAWHRRVRQKQNERKNSYSQPKQPPTGTTHRSITRLHRKINPRVKLQNSHVGVCYLGHMFPQDMRCSWGVPPRCASNTIIQASGGRHRARSTGTGLLPSIAVSRRMRNLP